VPVWTAEPGTADPCRDLVAALPDTVSDAVRRDTEPPEVAGRAAAWGAPPVVLRCGVPEPPRPAVAQLFTVDGVDWYAAPGSGGYFFTTVGRVAVVEVAVPDDYAPESDVLVDLAPSVTANVPLSAQP
jgi:hypothetical protein